MFRTAENYRSSTPPGSDHEENAPGIRAVLRDLVELAELQTVLFRLDADQAARRLERTFIVGAIGACLLLGAMPIALLGVADWLSSATGWSIALSRVVAAGFGVAGACFVLQSARRGMRATAGSFRRSRHEAARNVEWLKRALSQESR